MQITSSNILFFSIIAAIVPAFGYSLVIYWFDHYEKEPIWLLTATFFWGAVPSVILALIASLAFSAPLALIGGPSATNTIMAVFIAPPVEETVKAFALVAIFLMRREEIDSLLDGIIYGAMVGMGFAMVENIFYFVTVFQEQGVGAWGTTVFIRAVVFGLNHALFTSTTGLGLAVSRFSRARLLRIVTPIAGWSGAVMLHAVHNLAASNGGLLCLVLPFTDWGGVALILLIILWA
ncbi:MAG TPA: PrsW family intramembrane metalloprotease, partial [Candidatus Binatia bacterium]|nr:PrsW family intramembrane metalloprotease [Candidatus Binatia bacterium]